MCRLEALACDLNCVSDLISAICDALRNGFENLHENALDIPDDYLRRLNNNFNAFVEECSERFDSEQKDGDRL